VAINPNAPKLPEIDVALLSGTGQFVPNSPGYPEIDITLLPGVPGQGLDYSKISYTHNQLAAAGTWSINHRLKFKPNLTAFDSAGEMVEGHITHTDVNSLTITFSAEISGTAYLS
jgi:hypothetical protein